MKEKKVKKNNWGVMRTPKVRIIMLTSEPPVDKDAGPLLDKNNKTIGRIIHRKAPRSLLTLSCGHVVSVDYTNKHKKVGDDLWCCSCQSEAWKMDEIECPCTAMEMPLSSLEKLQELWPDGETTLGSDNKQWPGLTVFAIRQEKGRLVVWMPHFPEYEK